MAPTLIVENNAILGRKYTLTNDWFCMNKKKKWWKFYAEIKCSDAESEGH